MPREAGGWAQTPGEPGENPGGRLHPGRSARPRPSHPAAVLHPRCSASAEAENVRAGLPEPGDGGAQGSAGAGRAGASAAPAGETANNGGWERSRRAARPPHRAAGGHKRESLQVVQGLAQVVQGLFWLQEGFVGASQDWLQGTAVPPPLVQKGRTSSGLLHSGAEAPPSLSSTGHGGGRGLLSCQPAARAAHMALEL